VNVGCIPKKISWNAADLGGALRDAPDYAFRLEVAGHDWALLKQRRDAYILELNAVYAANLARRKVELVRARASFLDAGGVSAGGRRLQAPHIIIATGGRARRPLIPGAELGITSDGFFELSERPRRVAVVGSSYIAIELAGIFAGLGADTTLVLRGDTALKSFDDMLGEATLDMLREEGVDIVMRASPAALARGAGGALELAARDGRRLGRSIACCGRSGAWRRWRTSSSPGPAWRSISRASSPPTCTRRAARPGSMPSVTWRGARSSRRSRSRPAGGCRTGCLADRATGTWITRTFRR